METNKINTYTCVLGHQIVTIDRDEGVIPMRLKCYHRNCRQMAMSAFYKVDPGLEPTHEWYKPTESELEIEIIKYELQFPNNGRPDYKEWLAANTKAFRDHVANGGLLIRSIETVKQ